MKKVKIFLGVVICCGAILFNTFGLKQNASSQKLNLESFLTDAMAGTEGCTLGQPPIGTCAQNVSGQEWNCVHASFWDTKNCTGD